ncbi:type II toxin-antitoxin system Phd/YefM family antitoxin [Runella sp.]|uniref:type II toxin-antitoxin system Phd/YefM family antitoxin n=1 Tax=Runella sp. TaxID=1960881 RepID=UPI003D0996CF
MKIMTVGDLKTRFSEILQEVQAGEEIAVAFGKKKEIVAYLIPTSARKTTKRSLGILANKGKVTFQNDFSMTEEEFLGL